MSQLERSVFDADLKGAKTVAGHGRIRDKNMATACATLLGSQVRQQPTIAKMIQANANCDAVIYLVNQPH